MNRGGVKLEQNQDKFSPVPLVRLARLNVQSDAGVDVKCGGQSVALGWSDREQTRDKE